MSTELVVPADTSNELERRPASDRLRSAFAAHLAEFPRLAREPQPSLTQHLAYARYGEWTTSVDGPARSWHLAYTYLWVIPISAAAFALVWAVARPGRCATVGIVGSVLATALNAVPVLHAVVPDVATWTYWPPLSWLTETEAVG